TNLTKRIVAEVLEKAKDRNGVMLFAQNREHARQILSFLPAKESALVDSGTKDKERDAIIQKFKDRKLKYLTTVSALATGF
ncbi:helicase-related protein, partial [Priestia megaterium]|uniref:helicase-related protein n=1 Tax=Priestia megaterium TaxID=1404 RepID=UPI0035B65B43